MHRLARVLWERASICWGEMDGLSSGGDGVKRPGVRQFVTLVAPVWTADRHVTRTKVCGCVLAKLAFVLP
jgi:hypothetical protein